MNIQTKYVRANFVSSETILYNQPIAKKYYKTMKKNESNKKPILNNDSNIKNPDHEIDYSDLEKTSKRAEIEKWLKSMDLSSKIRLFSIESKWLTQMILQMFYYYIKNPDNKFLIMPDETPYDDYYLQYYYNVNQQNYNLNVVNDNNYQFDIFFKYENIPCDNLSLDEKNLLDKIRFFDLKDSNDSFTLAVSLLNNIEELFYYFDIFSKKKAFQNACT